MFSWCVAKRAPFAGLLAATLLFTAITAYELSVEITASHWLFGQLAFVVFSGATWVGPLAAAACVPFFTPANGAESRNSAPAWADGGRCMLTCAWSHHGRFVH